MTYTINDNNSILLVVDNEGEADTNSTTVRRAVITQNGQIVPTNLIVPGVKSIIIVEHLVQGTFQVKLESTDGTFIPDKPHTFDSLDAVAIYVASEVSQILPMIYIFDSHTRMVMLKKAFQLSGTSWHSYFIQDGQLVPTSFILPGIESIYVSELGPIYVVNMIYSNGECDHSFDAYDSLDEAITYITNRVLEALLSKIFFGTHLQM